MTEVSHEKRPKRKILLIILVAIGSAALLCALGIGGVGVYNLARNAIPAKMPAEMAGTWERQGNIFAFCSNTYFPQSMNIYPEGLYDGQGGSLWQGGEFQVLIGERVRVETRDGNNFYNYDLLVLENSSFLTFSTGLFNNCRVSYFSAAGLGGE